MVESATRFALLRTGETGLDANTAECLGYGDGGNGRQCQLQQREKLSKTEVGSPARIRTSIHGSKGRCPTISRPGNRWSKEYPFQCTRLLPIAATSQSSSPSSPCRYNKKRKAIWTGVRGGLQNRSAAVEVAGVFDSHCLPPSQPELSHFPAICTLPHVALP